MREVLTAAQAQDPGWGASIVVALTFGFGGIVLVWLGRRQAAGTLDRNGIAGYRTRTTMANDETWQAAHDATVRQTMWAGVVMIVGGALLLFNPPIAWWAVIVAVVTIGSMSLVLWGAIVAQRAARRVLEAEAGPGRRDP